MRTIGIIGGLGPGATAAFYIEFIRCFMLHHPNRRPPVHLYSIPARLRSERNFIATATSPISFLKPLCAAAEALKRAGADVLVIPCCSVQPLTRLISRHTSLPVISIIDSTARLARHRALRRVGLLATRPTLAAGDFQKAFAAANTESILPDSRSARHFCELISRIAAGHIQSGDCSRFRRHLSNWRRRERLDAVVLACTELHLLMDGYEDRDRIIDCLSVLVDATVEYIRYPSEPVSRKAIQSTTRLAQEKQWTL